jgi:hypothetical protein
MLLTLAYPGYLVRKVVERFQESGERVRIPLGARNGN